MFVNTAYWIYLQLDDPARHYTASACAYLGMTPERIKPYLDDPNGDESSYYIGLAQDLGFQFEKDAICVLAQKR